MLFWPKKRFVNQVGHGVSQSHQLPNLGLVLLEHIQLIQLDVLVGSQCNGPGISCILQGFHWLCIFSAELPGVEAEPLRPFTSSWNFLAIASMSSYCTASLPLSSLPSRCNTNLSWRLPNSFPLVSNVNSIIIQSVPSHCHQLLCFHNISAHLLLLQLVKVRSVHHLRDTILDSSSRGCHLGGTQAYSKEGPSCAANHPISVSHQVAELFSHQNTCTIGSASAGENEKQSCSLHKLWDHKLVKAKCKSLHKLWKLSLQELNNSLEKLLENWASSVLIHAAKAPTKSKYFRSLKVSPPATLPTKSPMLLM